MSIPWQELGGLGMLAAGSLGIGLLINGLRASPLPLAYQPPAARLVQSVERLSPPAIMPAHWRNVALDEVQERVAARTATILDARPAPFYRAGHLPGAINLPRADFETVYPKVRTLIEPSKTVGIIVYCSESDCQDSELVADGLARLGYRQIAVYKEGWEEWSRAGLPQETASSR